MSKARLWYCRLSADLQCASRFIFHAVSHVPETQSIAAMKTALLYAVGALLAIVVNIGMQELALIALSGFPWLVAVSVVAGTGAGLVFKYVWDKLLIFGFRPQSASRDLQAFGGYALTGIGTTAIFWGFEFGFDLVFGTKLMRYTGGVIGLVIGYVLKYRLDRRYVFVGGNTIS